MYNEKLKFFEMEFILDPSKPSIVDNYDGKLHDRQEFQIASIGGKVQTEGRRIWKYFNRLFRQKPEMRHLIQENMDSASPGCVLM